MAAMLHGCGNQSRVLSLLKFLSNCGVETHAFLGNHLISSLMTVGCISDAEQVFERLVLKNERTWRALIAGYIKYGYPQSALAAFQKMRKSFANPSEHMYAALLNSCTGLSDVKTGCALHMNIVVTGIETSFFVASSLIDMYGKCGFLEKSQKVFDMLSVQNIVTWNALMAAYVRHGDADKTIDCFEKMQLEGLLPDGFTFVLMVKACSMIRPITRGILVHGIMCELQLLHEDPYIGSSLVHMYANCGMLIEAQEMFNQLHLRDAVSWNAVIAGYVKHRCGEEALDCFQLMQQEEVAPTFVTYAISLKAVGNVQMGQKFHAEIIKKGLDGERFVGSALVDTYAKHGSLSHAEGVFDKLVHRTVVAWNSLIAGYVKYGYDKEALICFELMHVEHVSPSVVTFVCTLKACSKMGAVQKGEEIHMSVYKHGVENNLFIASAMIDAYSNCGLLQKAQELFGSILIRSIPVWNALFAGYAQIGEIRALGKILKQMVNEDMAPNPVTIEHFNCLVDILGRAGQVKNAITVATKMPFHPMCAVWHAVLGASRKWGNIESGAIAFNAIVGLDEEDDSAYTSMWNVYMDADIVEMIQNAEFSIIKVHLS